MRSVVQRVTPYVTSGMAGALESASDALQRLSIDPEKAREESRDRIQERGSRMRAQLEESLVPAARERSEAVLGRAREAVGGVTSSDSSSRGTLESVANRGQGAASAVARGSSYAAKETGATVIWLGIASALVYLILLSPERREQVKSFLCSAYEQARLLALDFRGYEPEM